VVPSSKVNLSRYIPGEKALSEMFKLHIFSGSCASLQEVSRFDYAVLVTKGTGILKWELEKY
jgi:hypothetical protein